MKTPNALIALLFAATSIVSVGAFAADADKAPAGEAPGAKAMPHSHMQEKTGMAPATKEGKEAGDEKAAQAKKASKARHLHPRDGK